MPNTTISPNMGMPVPVVGTDPGPDWATNINSSLSIIDSHNHSSGSGVQITPSGLNINADLPMNSNNLITIKSARFSAQNSPLSGGSDVGCLYESGVDLYYNDGNGNQVRITQGGSVTGSAGTITGLPSGTASASFSGGTFTFQSATSTPATMAVGPLVIGAASASPHTVTFAPSVSQPGDYNLTLPLSLPASTSFFNVDTSGNMATVGTTGSGTVVLSHSPTLVTPALGVPTSGDLTACVDLPIATGVSGLGTNVATFLAVPSSANLANALTDKTGTSHAVFATSPTIATATLSSPTITTPTISTPTFSGNPAGTVTSGSFTPTFSWNTTAPTINFEVWLYSRIGALVTVYGTVNLTSNADNTALVSMTIPVPTASLVPIAQGFGDVRAINNVLVTTIVFDSGSPHPITKTGSVIYSYLVS